MSAAVTVPEIDPNEIDAAKALLRSAGYEVFVVPPCNRKSGHGRHSLRLRNVMCEGAEPIPHGAQSGHMGSFGYWVNCQCGYSFADYDYSDKGVTPWAAHKAEHGIES